MIYRKSYSIFSYRRVRSTFRKAVNTQEMEKCMQQEITRVALDAMGGDNAPGELVKGAVDAVNGRSDIKVLLVGQQDVVEKELKQYSYPKEQIEVVHAEEVIETAEPPVNAIRKKETVINCCWNEYGKAERSRCFCFRRKFRRYPCRRTGYRWKNPRN